MRERFDSTGAGIYLGGPDNPINPRTLDNWRAAGIGPKYRKIGGLIRYDRADLDAWIEKHSKDPEAPRPRRKARAA